MAKPGYGHQAIITRGGKRAVHTFIGNVKRMILGTYHSVAAKHLDDYLAGCVHRANRRWLEANIFDRLPVGAVTGKPSGLRAVSDRRQRETQWKMKQQKFFDPIQP